MQVSKRNDFYQVSWISGPRHNFLAIALSEETDSETIISPLPPRGECRHAKLDEKLILDNVLEGATAANRAFGTKFKIGAIQYVENDTGPEEIFNFLTQKIIESLVKDET
jgi:hypothetical protein